MTQLVLSLFPGIGLLDMAFEEEGFVVVRGPDVLWGGDVRRFHPPAGKFDGVIGGPPCQAFSQLAHLVRAGGKEPRFGNLIPEYERCVGEAQSAWFLMENVRGAPTPNVGGYGTHDFLLDNCWILGEGGMGQEQERLRRFTFGVRGGEAPNLLRWIDLATLLLPEGNRSGSTTQEPVNNTPEAKGRKPAVSSAHAGHGRSRQKMVLGNGDPCPVVIGGSGKVKATVRHECVTGGHDRPPSARDRRPSVTGSDGGKSVRMARYTLADACRLQGLPEDFLADSPFRADGKLKAVANGVPIPMGRAVARAVKEAIGGF